VPDRGDVLSTSRRRGNSNRRPPLCVLIASGDLCRRGEDSRESSRPQQSAWRRGEPILAAASRGTLGHSLPAKAGRLRRSMYEIRLWPHPGRRSTWPPRAAYGSARCATSPDLAQAHCPALARGHVLHVDEKKKPVRLLHPSGGSRLRDRLRVSASPGQAAVAVGGLSRGAIVVLATRV